MIETIRIAWPFVMFAGMLYIIWRIDRDQRTDDINRRTALCDKHRDKDDALFVRREGLDYALRCFGPALPIYYIQD